MAVSKATPQDPEPYDVEVVPAASSMSGADVVQANARRDSLLDVMRKKYATEKRVRVKIKNDGPVPVQVNGYSFLIRENVWVEVPESVAQILDEAGYI